MPGPVATWRAAATDAAAAVLVPAVVIVAPLNDVIFRNIRDLQYHPDLVRWFAVAAAVLWAAGFVLLRLSGDRWPGRLWLTLPWALLLFDVLAGLWERTPPPLFLAAAMDVVIAGLVFIVARRVRASGLRQVAAAAGLLLAIHGVTRHVIALNGTPPEAVVGANRPARIDAPAPDAPGNVYHLLLDAYQSESFADSTGSSAAMRFPGFTYYRRFNTNFPRTSSAEPALIHGRFPTPGLSIEKWPELALADGFWRDLTSAQVGVWVYPYGRWLCPATAVKCVASSDLARDAGATTTRDTTIDLWAWRLIPPSLRQRLARDRAPAAAAANSPLPVSVTGFVRTMRGQNDREGTGTTAALPLQYFNLKQFDELLADEKHRPARGQYVYYHALIPHHDHIMDEHCGLVREPKYDAEAYWGHVACANLMIERLVRTLDDLGRLDDSLIVVHADHGAPEFLVNPAGFGRADDFALDDRARQYQAVDTTYRDFRAFEGIIQSGDSAVWRSFAIEVFSSGLLLVKHPRSHTYSEDDRPIQLLDIAPTVLAHFRVDAGSYPGLPLAQSPAEREQIFYAHSRNFDGKLSKYRLTNAGWTFVEDVPVTAPED